ncbi:hypothetical protein AN189_01650 [Loktanella sp. 3ANDIMAR09]|uniref:hypothetical protein n=1 Tax=Loktanella sp. 3ANDIMAR09 TaxID=1225657 RepID=UPI0006FC8C2E|nr:hypothetical protein [Loktanella sp. 3ANDIMAR09]KQI70126.1 hypothetical protein AN189_01650 [Loktanella sp. 3ANDIMAR09]
MISAAVIEQNVLKLLRFSLKHADRHGRVFYEKDGIIADGDIRTPNAKLPIDEAARDFYLQLMLDEGLILARSPLNDLLFDFKLTPKGAAFLCEHRSSWIKRQLEVLKQNMITIVVSVTIAVITAWILGPST